MKFELLNPVLLGINQLDNVRLFRGGRSETRSHDVHQKWNRIQIVSGTGYFEEHHIYIVVSRQRTRFAPLQDFPANHFLLDHKSRTSPVEINFSDLSSCIVYPAVFDLDSDIFIDTLMHGVRERLNITELQHIAAEPCNQKFVTAASFIFANESLNVPCSPDLWRFIRFPNALQGEGPSGPTPFDFRIEYIGKSINPVEERLSAHEHVRRIQTELSSQEPNRESFVVLYQVDYQTPLGKMGIGSRNNQIELGAAEAILIQYFKPRFNTRSTDFSLSTKNTDPIDEELAKQMRNSGNFAVGSTSLILESPSKASPGSLLWGRYFTSHHAKTSCMNEIVF
ncbi:hypothetical protein [Rhodoferax sp. WC2427]|uniref:hypothetical protein n=1 Tax=Rhodoferax sp. WC2427 TaxID=3234144 RepID=UPI003467BECA